MVLLLLVLFSLVISGNCSSLSPLRSLCLHGEEEEQFLEVAHTCVGAHGWGPPVPAQCPPVSQHNLIDVTGLPWSPVESRQLCVGHLAFLGNGDAGGPCERHRLWGPRWGMTPLGDMSLSLPDHCSHAVPVWCSQHGCTEFPPPLEWPGAPGRACGDKEMCGREWKAVG